MSKTTNKYSPEVRERAVRLVPDNPGPHESHWSAIVSVSAKIGCAAHTPNGWSKRLQRGPWHSFHAVKYATLEWIDGFNNRRLLDPIGNVSPAEAEANCHTALEYSDHGRATQINQPAVDTPGHPR